MKDASFSHLKEHTLFVFIPYVVKIPTHGIHKCSWQAMHVAATIQRGISTCSQNPKHFSTRNWIWTRFELRAQHSDTQIFRNCMQKSGAASSAWKWTCGSTYVSKLPSQKVSSMTSVVVVLVLHGHLCMTVLSSWHVATQSQFLSSCTQSNHYCMFQLSRVVTMKTCTVNISRIFFVLRCDEVHHVNAKNQHVSTERAAPDVRIRDRVGCPRNNRRSSSAKRYHRPCPCIFCQSQNW